MTTITPGPPDKPQRCHELHASLSNQLPGGRTLFNVTMRTRPPHIPENRARTPLGTLWEDWEAEQIDRELCVCPTSHPIPEPTLSVSSISILKVFCWRVLIVTIILAFCPTKLAFQSRWEPSRHCFLRLYRSATFQRDVAIHAYVV